MRREIGSRRPVVLTTDCGADMDDQWALAHLALTPEIDLRGVVTTHAPNLTAPAAETAARIAAEVLAQPPITVRPPVLAGSSAPLAGRDPRPNPGVDFLLERSRDHAPDDRLVVLMIGAATDVASAMLTDDTLAERIEIVAMAFDGWPDGGDAFNVRNDVLAWQVVLESPASVTVGDAAVTLRDLSLTRERARELFGDRGRAGPYLVHLLGDWLDAHPDLVRRVTGDAGSWPVWDEVVVAHLLGFTSSATYPRPVLRDDLSFVHPGPRKTSDLTIEWVTRIDSRSLWQHLGERLAPTQPTGPG